MTKTPEEIDRFIHKAMGKCWHENVKWFAVDKILEKSRGTCPNCRMYVMGRNIDGKVDIYLPTYLTHNPAWGEMLDWARHEPWWIDFIYVDEWHTDRREIYKTGLKVLRPDTVALFADPPALATKLTEYLEGEK